MRNRFYMKSLAFISLIIFFLISCEYEVIEPTKVELPPKTNDSDSVSVYFVDDIIPIFNASCNTTGCHDVASAKAGLDLSPDNAYQSMVSTNMFVAKDPDNSPIYTKIKGGGTHDGKASVTEIAYIKTWIEEGALNNKK